MREIERLAQEWWLKQCDLMNEGEAESYEPDPTSFKAGFRAARELAAVEAEKLLYPLAPNPMLVHTVERIRKLGEDELAEK